MENTVSHNQDPTNVELMRTAREITLAGMYDSQLAWNGLNEADAVTEIGDVHNFDGDRATLGELRSEEAILSAASAEVERTGDIYRWASEEHAHVTHLGDGFYNEVTGDGARGTIVNDGIDGTSVAKADWAHGEYGGMAAFAEGGSPTYDDCLAASIGMFPQYKVLYAEKGAGAWVFDAAHIDHAPTPARVSQARTLSAESVGFAEQKAQIKPGDALHGFYTTVTRDARMLQRAGLQAPSSGSTAANAYKVATGAALFDVSATRKGNLEQMPIYRIVQEAGGVMYAAERDAADGTLKFVDLGSKNFFSYAQDEYVTLITAANDDIANQLLVMLNGATLEEATRIG